ncbi:hypothetical protein CPB83DRAFT_27589 [Crepidotus variabilis]|uniref:Uncharacterized protein n=1 Tax=Crepidotus variabilis TaxID=179855 RepID=A0A9P6JWX3_9AGAR|nr:hypothetical protein CPB83DRAFT_27589 [Crepidotus variabilis]
MGIYALCTLLLWLHGCTAAFTKSVRWPGSNLAIQRDTRGSWCFLPVAGETSAVDCKGDHADLQETLNAHMKQDLSIAYYNAIDNSRRGDASWSIPTGNEVIHLCASGKSGDGAIQTICSTVTVDDQFAGTPYCEVAVGPSVVSDGCYTVDPTSSPHPPASVPPTTSSPSFSTTPTQLSNSITNLSSKPSITSTNTSQLAGTPTSTTINVTANNPTNPVVDIAVPIIVAVLGVVAAAISARVWWSKKKLAQELARRNRLINVIH